MTLSLIAAASENNVIGRRGMLPWRLPADMRHFKERTIGHPVIMGRKTYQSIGRPLPGRRNIVISRQKGLQIVGCDIAGSLEEALSLVRDDLSGEAFVIGGGEIYREALPHADRIYLTRVHATVEGDAFFPELSPGEWREVSREENPSDGQHPHAYSFIVYERR